MYETYFTLSVHFRQTYLQDTIDEKNGKEAITILRLLIKHSEGNLRMWFIRLTFISFHTLLIETNHLK